MSTVTLKDLKLGYKVNPCELIMYNNKCYRANQKCLNKFNYEDYYPAHSQQVSLIQ